MATELLFVYVYCLVDDAIKAGALLIPRRPGPAPACTDAELLTIALVRHLLGRRSESGFLAEVRRDWLHLFPHLPDQPEVNRRIRWLWGAFEQLRAAWAAAVPADPVQQIDTSALPVKHPSRVRGPDGWTGPGNDLAARFGRDGAHAEWFYGFRLAIRTDLGRRIVRAWSIVPAVVDERRVGTDLAAGDAAAIDALLQDKGFTGTRFAGEMAGAGIEVIIPPTRAQRATMARTLQRLIARLRNRVETSFKEITGQMELARHGAHTFEGLLTRTAAVLAAHTLLLTELLSDAELVCLAARRYCRASLAADLLRPARAPVPVPSETARLSQAAQGGRAAAGYGDRSPGRAWLDRAPRGRNETGPWWRRHDEY